MRRRRRGAAFGPARNCTREVDRRSGGRSTRQNEAVQRFQIGIHHVDLPLHPFNLRRNDAKRPGGFITFNERRGEIGAKVEHIVLDRAQPARLWPVAQGEDGEPDSAVGFIDIADRRHARIVLGYTRSIHKAGRAGIPGTRIYLVELDQELQRLVIGAVQQHQQGDEQNGNRLKADAGEHHLVLFQARRTGARLGRVQFFLRRLKEDYDAPDQSNDGRDGGSDDEQDEKSVHDTNLGPRQRNANRKHSRPQIARKLLRINAKLAKFSDGNPSTVFGQALAIGPNQ